MSNSGFRSSYIAKRNKRFGQLTLADDLFNLNQSTAWVTIPFETEEKIDKGFEYSANGLIAKFTDWVDADAMVYMESAVARPNVEIVFAINDIERAKIGASGYIRNSNGHNHASCHITDGFFVNEGDVITLKCRREANAGTVISPANSSIIKLTSSPVAISKGPSGTYFEGFELDFGNWVQGGSADWLRLTGATPSSGTGSAGAKTGAYYAYCEMSSNGFLETYSLSTSYFNFLRTVSFSYQLEGANAGTLLLQYKNKYGAWVTKWSVSGDQGTAYIDVVEDFTLVPDIDDVTEVRFYYSGATDFAGDCCIDDVTVVSV